LTFFLNLIIYNQSSDIMKVKIFDEEHESDLEKSINEFISSKEIEVVDIKFQTSVSIFGEEQIFCFSAMVIYY